MRATVFVFVFLASACSGSTTGPVDAATPDAGVTDAVMEDAATCGSARLVIGSGGGRISTCGASLEIPAGALVSDREFAIDVLPIPGEPLFDFSFVSSHAFRFSSSELNLGFTATIELPHDGFADREAIAAVYDSSAHPDSWFPIPACSFSATHAHVAVGSLGTFSVLARNAAYPVAPTGLGEGTINATFQGTTLACDVQSSITGYAVRSDTDTGVHQFRIACDGLPEGASERVSLQWVFSIDAAGLPADAPIVSWQVTGTTTMWSYSTLDTSLSPPSVWTASLDGDAVQAHLAAEFWHGTEHGPFDLSLVATPAPFRDRIFDDPVCE